MALFDSPKWRVLKGLRAYLRPHRRKLAAGFLCVFLTNLFLLAMPTVLGYAVDSLQYSVTREKLTYWAALVVALAVCEGVFRFFMRHLIIGVSRDVEYAMRNDIFRHLETLPMSFYQRNKTGDLMSRATNDLSNVRMLFGPGIMYTANTIVVAVVAILFMLRINWQLTLLALLPLPFVSLSVRYFGKKIHDLTEESQAKLADLSARVQESMAGIRVVKAFSQETHEIGEFEGINRSLVSKNQELIRFQSVFYPTMELMIGTAVVIVIWFGGRQVIQNAISLGDFVAFTMYLGRLSWPMIALGWVVNLLERGRASMERLNYILETIPDVRNESPVAAEFEVSGEIEFRNLSFSYDGTPTLRNISLRIPKGRTVAIVGATGSGKTSLVQLIPRLYNAPMNSLFIDGVPIERIPLSALRSAIGFIPQDTFLFGETIRENIAFGVESAADSQILHAARVSNIEADVESFPDKFETMVGERGITLSGGQKQRTAISRAVLRDPRILILDDALSSVDTYTEEQILRELKGVMQNRTSILISHRVSTVRDADEIVVLNEGQIVERGTHAELLTAEGYYAELYRRQLLEEELAVSD
ncbi:MAG TPA: ABC transporter ATP-binding protein [Terriglobia bacterium]|jgi:ATP-binding cassette subfamily B protein